jgi:hypothetical protein
VASSNLGAPVGAHAQPSILNSTSASGAEEDGFCPVTGVKAAQAFAGQAPPSRRRRL